MHVGYTLWPYRRSWKVPLGPLCILGTHVNAYVRLSEITKGPVFAMERVAVVRFDRFSNALVL